MLGLLMRFLSSFQVLKPLGVLYEVQESNDIYGCKLCKAIINLISKKTRRDHTDSWAVAEVIFHRFLFFHRYPIRIFACCVACGTILLLLVWPLKCLRILRYSQYINFSHLRISQVRNVLRASKNCKQSKQVWVCGSRFAVRKLQLLRKLGNRQHRFFGYTFNSDMWGRTDKALVHRPYGVCNRSSLFKFP